LIDVSGSMDQENKLPLVQYSLKKLTSQLRSVDKVSIVVYAGAAGLVLKPTSDKKKIIDALDKLHAGGSTAGGQGLELAYKVATENFIKNGNNRIIIATDGDFNVGISDKNGIVDYIEGKRSTGVAITCLGYGMGNYNDVILENIANKGNGNYAYIDNAQEATRYLVKEFSSSMLMVAKDVKIQIDFNPLHVKAYRLIGYENRMLKTEDFKNDKIDAGDMGAGHTVTALYEIIPTGSESDLYTDKTNSKYTSTQNNSSYNSELATVKFRYKKPDGEISKELTRLIGKSSNDVSNDYKFASSVAWFGLKLRNSKLIKNDDIDEMIELAKNSIENDSDGYY
jgi:Ca-activated chloride channel homolog